jgi:ADP-heptose:LPS heptosyltransferase
MANLKNTLIRKALLTLCPSTSSAEGEKRILIVATTALGDTLWATPAIESIRKSFPACYIAVLASPLGIEILKGNPHIDRLYPLIEPLLPRFFSLRKTLLAERFNTILHFHASQRLALPLVSTLGAKKIVGTLGINKGFDNLLTHPLPNLYQHEIMRRLKMVEEIGGRVHSETLSFYLSPEEKRPKREGLWIAIHPGSKDEFKRWPAKNFAAVGCALREEFGCEILVTGSRGEGGVMRETAALIPGAQMARTDLPLRSFAALLDQMDLLITNDTGPFHLASALDRPAIGIYAATDPLLCGPHKAKKSVAIAKNKSCTPCIKRKCPSPFCLLQIGPCEVTDIAIKQLTWTQQPFSLI